jgi:hypothetical protein
MGRWVVGIVLKGLIAVLCLAAVAWLALWYFMPAPPTSIVIATGLAGGTLDHIAQRYRISLAPHIPQTASVGDADQIADLARRVSRCLG